MDEPAYGYLLSQYLGDGCVSRIGRSFRLRVSCCDDYPGIMDEVEESITRVMPGRRVGRIQRPGCAEVYATSLHWPHLVPHGPGRKHLRPIDRTGVTQTDHSDVPPYMLMVRPEGVG